jgi:hypothetical protein
MEGEATSVMPRNDCPKNEQQESNENNYFEKAWLTPLPPPLPHTMSALFLFLELTDPTLYG